MTPANGRRCAFFGVPPVGKYARSRCAIIGRFIKLRDPNSPGHCLIKRRRVIYVSGYDPQGPQGYYALFESQLKRACALWHTKFVLSPLAIESADIASWIVTMGGPNWQALTRYDFIRQENFINANCNEPIIRQIFRAVRWMLNDLATGTTFRVFRANWQFGMHHLVLQLLLLTWIAISIATGAFAWYIARHRVGVATPISLAMRATTCVHSSESWVERAMRSSV